MAKKKVCTRADLAQRIVEEMGIPMSMAQKLVGDSLTLLIDCLRRRETLKITSFATFKPYKKKRRKGRNMATGEPVDIPERYVIQFIRSDFMDKKIHSSR